MINCSLQAVILLVLTSYVLRQATGFIECVKLSHLFMPFLAGGGRGWKDQFQQNQARPGLLPDQLQGSAHLHLHHSGQRWRRVLRRKLPSSSRLDSLISWFHAILWFKAGLISLVRLRSCVQNLIYLFLSFGNGFMLVWKQSSCVWLEKGC